MFLLSMYDCLRQKLQNILSGQIAKYTKGIFSFITAHFSFMKIKASSHML